MASSRLKKILIVCKCIGGTNSIKPVVELLEKMGLYDFEWIKHDRPDEIKYIPDAIITSVCSRIGRDVARNFVGKCPIIAIQNQWTAGLYDIWANADFKPDFVLVNDKIDRRQTVEAWPGFNEERAIITGYPAMDKYANFDIDAARARVTQSLGIDVSGRIPVILFAGQWWQTGHAILETVFVLNQIGRFVHFIPRPHPGMKEHSYEELPAWERALSSYDSGNLVVNSSSCAISDLVGASTLVVSLYSTVLQEAAILRKQNIAILYPDTGQRLYEAVSGVSDYPMVSLGCTALAKNREDLSRYLRKALDNSLDLENNQKKYFKIDGQNTARVAEVITLNV